MGIVTTHGRLLDLTIALAIGFGVQSVHAAGQGSRGKPDTSAEAMERRVAVRWEKVTLDQTLAYLSDRCGLAAIANGDPRAETITLTFEGSVRNLLDRIGEAFDLHWSRKGGVILLAKRFTDPNDRPQAYLPEMRESLRDVLGALPRLEPIPLPERGFHTGWDLLLKRFWNTLDPAVSVELQSQTKIQVSRLSPSLVEALRMVVLHRAYGEPVRILEKTLFMLDNFANAQVVSDLVGTFRPAAGPATESYRVSIAVTSAGRRELEVIGALRKPVAQDEKKERGR